MDGKGIDKIGLDWHLELYVRGVKGAGGILTNVAKSPTPTRTKISIGSAMGACAGSHRATFPG